MSLRAVDCLFTYHKQMYGYNKHGWVSKTYTIVKNSTNWGANEGSKSKGTRPQTRDKAEGFQIIRKAMSSGKENNNIFITENLHNPVISPRRRNYYKTSNNKTHKNVSATLTTNYYTGDNILWLISKNQHIFYGRRFSEI